MRALVLCRAAVIALAAGMVAMHSVAKGHDHSTTAGMQEPAPTPEPSQMPMPPPSPSPPPQDPPAGMEGMDMPAEPKPLPSRGLANSPSATPKTDASAAARDTKRPPNLVDRSGWPSPTADDAIYTFVLFDLLEYQRVGRVNAVRWDVLGWRGGDTNRFWFKSEGNLTSESPMGGEADVQALYGRMISPFFDLQLGARVEQRYERDSKPTRIFAVVGLQGLAPGRFEVEPALFLSNKGKVSGRFTGTLDLYQTQRLIWQPRLETNFAAQRDDDFGVERGLNDVEFGLRLRYEIRREFAPYLGVSYRQSFGATRERVLREGGNPGEVQFSVGVRLWR